MTRQPILAALLLVALLLAACSGEPIAQPAGAPAVGAQPTLNPNDLLQPHPTPFLMPGPPVATLSPAPAGSPGPKPAVAPMTNGFLIYTESDGSLWRADRPGLPLRQLTPPSADGTAPSWVASPDGTTIAVIISSNVYPPRADKDASAAALWLVNADGSGARKVLDLLPPNSPVPQLVGAPYRDVPPTIALQAPAWSPDGALVAFISAHTGVIDLYTATHGGTLARLTDTPQVEQALLWSPNGALIAYQTTSVPAPGAVLGLAVSRRDGGAPVFSRAPLPLSDSDDAAEIIGRTWTDNQTLAVGLSRGPLCGGEVQVLDIVAGMVTSILRRAEGCVGPPTWGAGARMLTISVGGNTAEPAGLYRWAPGDSQATRIAPGALEIDWNPAGDVLTYRLPSAKGDHSTVVLWHTGAEPIVIENVDWPPHWSADGRMLALGAAILDADGRRVATLPDPWASPIGWGAYGLYYSILHANPAVQTELWLWDGRATHLLYTLSNDDARLHTGVVAGRALPPSAGRQAYVLLTEGVNSALKSQNYPRA